MAKIGNKLKWYFTRNFVNYMYLACDINSKQLTYIAGLLGQV